MNIQKQFTKTTAKKLFKENMITKTFFTVGSYDAYPKEDTSLKPIPTEEAFKKLKDQRSHFIFHFVRDKNLNVISVSMHYGVTIELAMLINDRGSKLLKDYMTKYEVLTKKIEPSSQRRYSSYEKLVKGAQ